MHVDTFDLSAFEHAAGADRAELAGHLDQICRQTGFVVLSGHGVDTALIEAIWQQVTRFFDLPQDEKQKVSPSPGRPYGYLAIETEALAASRGEDTPPDLKESFNGGPASVPAGLDDPEAIKFCYAETPWPDLPEFETTWQAYYRAQENLAERLMRAFAAALGLREDYFDPFIDQPISALRALNYPATRGNPAVGQQRAGAHSDYGTLTILLPQPDTPGLQILAADGSWIDVIAPAGCYIVNIGDLMARWTADKWVSTLHRVVAAPDQARRQSLAFFHQPNWHAEIRPLDSGKRYPPVCSGPYLMSKFQSTGRVDTDE